MCVNSRILSLLSVLSVFVAAATIATWAAASRQDIFIPVGGQWYLSAWPDRWELGLDPGGWTFFTPPGGYGGGFFPDGLNAKLALERRSTPGPCIWPERTLFL